MVSVGTGVIPTATVLVLADPQPVTTALKYIAAFTGQKT
jgi:hypothetical protein